VLFTFYIIVSIAVLVGAIFSPQVRAYSYAPLRDLLLPPPKPVTIYLLYSTEKEAWLSEAIELFSQSKPTYQGRPIEVITAKSGSREMYLAVLSGEEKPTILSPASSLQSAILEDLSATRFGRPVVQAKNPALCRSVLQSPLVLAAWRERAEAAFGSQVMPDLWHRIHDLAVDTRGWESLRHPEWGYFKFGHTNPLSSNSGFMTIVLMTYSYFGKTEDLTSEDILSNNEFQKWFLELEGTITNFGESTGTYMRDIVAYGPSMYDMVSVYEASAIEQAENASGRYGELHFYYPPATILSDHPFCILDAEWVTTEQKTAAAIFIDFLLSKEVQQLGLMKYGFRPALNGIPLDQPGSPFQRFAVIGLDANLPPVAEIPSSDVLNTLLDFWARNIQR
jgi:hypothetical protein